jgi:predicted N-acetyltransferase YhbS/uncharacterized glyoxalase superfamily protein PhnB
MALKSSEPIFAVADVLDTVRFYREVLGFEGQWLWGDPPTFAGLRWGKVSVMLCRQPELAGEIEGHMHFFDCEDVDALYERHKTNGAPIISEIENKPWGRREYAVRDVNGYHLRFAGPIAYERPAGASRVLPDFIRVIERLPTVQESATLTKAVGWNNDPETIALALRNSLYGVVAVDTRSGDAAEVVGSIRVVGDGAKFFYVQDVMVVPQFQNQRVGSAMMETVMAWLKKTARKGASVGLFSGKPEFYERFGFTPGYGMSLFF